MGLTYALPIDPPRITTTQRDALPGVQNGEIIYNTTVSRVQMRENGAWVNATMLGDAAGGDLTGTYPNPTLGSGVVGDANIDIADPIGDDKLVVPTLHLVGGSGEPAFSGTWANVGSAEPAGFYLSRGSVFLQGEVTNSADPGANSNIFILPTGFRPAANTVFGGSAISAGTTVAALMTVLTTGNVRIVTDLSTSPHVYLNGLRFRAA